MASKRLDIDAAVVEAAIAQAKAGVQGIFDYVDVHRSYLVLRVRGNAVSWLVKTRDMTRKIGAPPAMLVRKAKETAQETLIKLRRSPAIVAEDDGIPSAATGWTWDTLRKEYKKHVSNPRMKRGRPRHASNATVKDVELSLGRTAFEPWITRPINALTPGELVAAILKIQETHSHRQCEKSLSYTKAALTWALSNKPVECGLDQNSPWWMTVQAPARPTEEIARVLERQKAEPKKEQLTVEYIGVVLARHENFCSGKFSNEMISPGVRWGLWWAALTVNRRGAATMLSRSDISWEDPRGLPGWGLVSWPAELMKARIDFWLPIPPLGKHILKCVMRDWRKLVNKSHGARNQTQWAFASTRRIGRTDETIDVVLAPDALSNHLRNLRGKRGHGHRNLLKDLPYFSLHDLRDACASYLLDRDDLPPGAASAMLAHTIKGDVDPRHEKMSPTTRQFYDFAQRIPLKTKAMEAWSKALLDAYDKAGGIYPE